VKFLIIEDDPMIAEALQDILEVMGHTSSWFSHGNNIAEILDSIEFEAVILDLELPGKSGVDIAKEIYERNGEARIIFSTGYSEQVEEIRNLPQATCQLINKPFDMNDIRNAISRLNRK